MPRPPRSAAPILFLILLGAPALPSTRPAPAAQADPPTIAGHWDGTLKLEATTLEFDVDFAPGNPGGGAGVDAGAGAVAGWTGDLSLPAQAIRDMPMAEVTVKGDRVAFTITGLPGNPSFRGKLSADGSSIQGTMSQFGKTGEVTLTRAVDPASAAATAMQGFDAVVDKAMKDFRVPGLAIAVVKDGKVAYARGFGRRDVDKGLPVTPRTLFAIGSCTKAFTTFVMGTLVDEGKLDWDAPLRTYLPGLRMSDPIATESITPRDLVTHRSGLPRHDLAWYNTRLTGQDVFTRLAHFEPTEPLRARFQYNNMMFMLAGYLVEKVDGRSWEESVRARVLGPLEMTSTNFSVLDSQKSDDFARPYDEQQGKVRVIPFRDITSVGPAGAINSNAADMARWVAVHAQGGKSRGKAILAPATLAELHAPQMTIGQPSSKKEISPASYAMGWATDTYRGHRRVHHGGAIDGFTADTCLFPDDGLGLVILTNKDSTPLPGLIGRHAADRLLGLKPIDWLAEGLARHNKSLDALKAARKNKDSVRRPGTRPAHPLEEYAGEYEHPGYGRLDVALKDGKLVATYNGIAATLEHWHYEVFNAPKADNDPALADINWKLQFRTNVQGYVDAVFAPLEPSVKPIVFVRRPDRKLSDPDYLKRFEGRYELAGQTASIQLKGRVLTLQQENAPPVELVPDRDDGFTIKRQTGASIRFNTDPQGGVTGLSLSTDDGVFTATRKPPGN
jgi:CubicO group peptidase (beta-lactamase class C family)